MLVPQPFALAERYDAPPEQCTTVHPGNRVQCAGVQRNDFLDGKFQETGRRMLQFTASRSEQFVHPRGNTILFGGNGTTNGRRRDVGDPFEGQIQEQSLRMENVRIFVVAIRIGVGPAPLMQFTFGGHPNEFRMQCGDVCESNGGLTFRPHFQIVGDPQRQTGSGVFLFRV